MVKNNFKLSTGGMMVSVRNKYNILSNILTFFTFLLVLGSNFESEPVNEPFNHEQKGLGHCICTCTHQYSTFRQFKVLFDHLWLISFDFGKILIIFSKILNFRKIPRNFKFPSNPAILCFLDSKNSNKPNILSRGGFGGSRMTFFD